MHAAHRGVRSRIAEHRRTNGRDDGDRAKPHLGGMKEERTPDIWTCLWRGWRGRCPRCGAGSLFSSFLKMRNHCPACELALEPYRADDAPAYFTIFAVGTLRRPAATVGSCGIVASAFGCPCTGAAPSHKRRRHCAPVGAPDSCSQAFAHRELRPLSLKTWPPADGLCYCRAVAGYGSVADPFST